jgi:para-aminobenzoate synthetase component 1
VVLDHPFLFNPEFMRLTADFKHKALHWADTFPYCCILDSNSYPDPYGKYDFLIAAGARQVLHSESMVAFEDLKSFYKDNPGWLFGIMGYDLKNGIEALQSSNPDPLEFPQLCFFTPEYLIIAENGILRVEIGDPELLNEIQASNPEAIQQTALPEIIIQSRLQKEVYLNKIQELKRHISRGDIYEITFCQEFFAEHARINPAESYARLNINSPTPFSGYLKLKDKYLLCASPERFLRKQGHTMISQPIKGTAKRSTDAATDAQIKAKLAADLKEQTENVMIVDLVRNDLTKSAVPASVKVEEQFGIYSFAQVHQMISTISCELHPEIHFVDAIKNTFPMGSMTGAPKVRAMQLIDMYEESTRGAYSGAMGYISPEGDFDFNVVIRSMLYAADKAYLSFQVGSAITDACIPEKEYEECMLKASAIIETIKGPQ